MKTTLIALLMLAAFAGCAQRERRGSCLATDAQCISDFKQKEASDKAARRTPEAGGSEAYRRFKQTCQKSEADCKNEWLNQMADGVAAKYAARDRLNEEKRKEEEVKRNAMFEEKERQQAAEADAREAQFQKRLDADRKEERAAQNAAAKREQEAKARCGADYRQPKIGMSIYRAQECVGKFRMTNQLNRADGVVSTYQGSGMYLHVMDGQVVSWGKY